MNNQLQKKNSLWKDIYNIYSFEINLIIGIPLFICLFIFIPYYVGSGLDEMIPFFASTINAEKDESMQVFLTWTIGMGVIYGPLIVTFIVGCLIRSLVIAIEDIKNALKIIKKLSYLPTTEEELKALSINTFDEFDKFVVDFFGIYEVGSNNVWEELTHKLKACLKLLPLPEAVAYLNNYKLHKNRYITLRSEILANKILGHEHDFWNIRKLMFIREEYESIEAKKKLAKEAGIAYIWTPGDPICPCCGEDKFKDLDADIWADWQPRYCPNCGAKIKEYVVERG